MALLQQNGRVTVEEVSEKLEISLSTTRIQLQKMHDKGLLLRTHGGAVKVDYPESLPQKSPYGGIVNFDAKLQIAQAAAETVRDGDYIAISSGSTSLLFATLLHNKSKLTVVTDSVLVAHELLFDRQIRLYICGGEVQHRNSACSGPTAEAFLDSLKVDKSYYSADSINFEFGITSIDIDPRSEVSLCKCGRECFVLADHTKFQVRPFIEKSIGLDEVTHLISDSKLEQEYITRLEALGINVIIGRAEE